MMSIYTGRPDHTQNLATHLMMRFPGVRDHEDARSITIGGLSDLPPVYPGTIDQHSEERYIYFSDLREHLVYEPAPTGTSIVTESVKVRFPVTFEFEIIDNDMIQLEKVAENRDERAFVEAIKNMDWENRSQGDILRGIQFAFKAGAHIYARRLATDGNERYPRHQELQKYARFLAPPEVLHRNLPPDPTLRANRDWLKTHRDEYKGQWVALLNGELLGAAPKLKTLRSIVGQKDGILFAKVS